MIEAAPPLAVAPETAAAEAPGDAALVWVECPRDAWQGLTRTIPSGVKASFLRSLLGAGFRRLDLGSFVSPAAVPQMADTEAVLAELERPADGDFLCIVGNPRGLERALATPGVSSVGYPLSVNATFQERNLGRSLERSWRELDEIHRRAADGGLELVVYVSMGFGNPYGDPWAPPDTAATVDRLRGLGVERIALADTVGSADPPRLTEVLAAIDAPRGLGLHLHARPDRWGGQLEVALERGLRWFEGALAGVGGCPFAGDALVGNLPSERALPWLAERGLRGGIELTELPALARRAAEIAARYA